MHCRANSRPPGPGTGAFPPAPRRPRSQRIRRIGIWGTVLAVVGIGCSPASPSQHTEYDSVYSKGDNAGEIAWNDTRLAKLEIKSAQGTLSPSFHPDIHNYVYIVDMNHYFAVNEMSIRAQTANPLAQMGAGGTSLPNDVSTALALTDAKFFDIQVSVPGAPERTYHIKLDPRPTYLKSKPCYEWELFGYAIAMDGNTIVVGAPLMGWEPYYGEFEGLQKFGELGSGAALVFVRENGVWSQQGHLRAPNQGMDDQFGLSVAIAGDTIVVGAPFEDSSGAGMDEENNLAEDSGAAYVFIRRDGIWSHEAYLKPSNISGSDAFGRSVAIDGDKIVVGAPYEGSSATGVNGDEENEDAPYSGAAYIFQRQAGSWSQQAYLKPSNTGTSDLFGYSVAIAKNTVVIGSPYEDGGGVGVNPAQETDDRSYHSGAAYVFTRHDERWTQRAYLKAENSDANDQFGFSVDMDDDAIIVGAPGEMSKSTGVDGVQQDNGMEQSGAAYIFSRKYGTWSQSHYLKASNTDLGDAFGSAVSMDGDWVVVGAPNEDSESITTDGHQANNNNADTGAAYLFHRSNGKWKQKSYLKAPNADDRDSFGHSVVVSGTTAMVGAMHEDGDIDQWGGPPRLYNWYEDSGAAYIFQW